MNYSFSLESVNMLTSGPNFIYKQSKGFWVSYFKYIAAAGFSAVELPFNPFSSDPMAFETGRCGIPCNAGAIASKYGSPSEFRDFLRDIGIEDISGIHVSANDAMLEAVAAGLEPTSYYGLFEDMLGQALSHCASLGAKVLVVSPSPELGWLTALLPQDNEEVFNNRTVSILSGLVQEAKKAGITVAVRSEFWSFYRGINIESLVHLVPGLTLCPDAAHIKITGRQSVTEVLESFGGNICCPRLTDTAFSDTAGNALRINAEIPVEGPQKVFCDLGDGEVDLLACARLIEASGYEGYTVVEQRKTLDPYRALLKLRWYLDHEISAKLR
jgi:sugar phosphate isomerase/epimerase